ncbi:MAG: DJ-1/PfpI family protein [Erythrobacter sp.]|uniref:DJ-1/PfpI family protein n=1 Tax=Erythrobacter sp. TaxID=1042 RepID=UPI001B1EAE12|nr:DJ-1/PfpI family protein [Erythrobacter sp.]MBO6767314.1 DJ-1/PfpI family protein [Erythrobacter sp.]
MQPITIVLTESWSDWEVSVLGGVGRAFYGADIRFTSPDGDSLTSAAGLQVTDLARFEAPSTGIVVICGGPAFESDMPPEIADRLRAAWDAGCTLAAICGGTIALARAGLLDGAQHTSNGPGYLDGHVPEYKGTAHYIDQPQAVATDRIITAPAPAPASFAAEVLKAAGLDVEAADGICAMLAAEHAVQKTT